MKQHQPSADVKDEMLDEEAQCPTTEGKVDILTNKPFKEQKQEVGADGAHQEGHE